MARSQETFNKKAVKDKKDKKRKEKEKRLLERREGGKSSFEDMIVYVDENGQLTETPPEAGKREYNAEDIEIGVPKREDVAPEDNIRQGVVSYYNESKGYGFIKDSKTGDSVFVHANQLQQTVSEGNKVSFEVEKGQRGPAAVRVKKES